MSAEDHPAMELTRDPINGTWGFICREHGVHRHGLTERHATNVEAKHVREDHADQDTPTLNLTELAAFVWANNSGDSLVWDAWERLTGLTGGAAVDFGAFCLDTDAAHPVTAAVVPF
jgi:hypothetical protein